MCSPLTSFIELMIQKTLSQVTEDEISGDLGGTSQEKKMK